MRRPHTPATRLACFVYGEAAATTALVVVEEVANFPPIVHTGAYPRPVPLNRLHVRVRVCVPTETPQPSLVLLEWVPVCLTPLHP